MKTVSSDYKDNIIAYGKQIDSIITYNNGTQEVVLGASQLNAVTPSFEGSILKSTMKQLVIDSNIEIPVNTEVNYKFGLLVDGDYEYINYGNYIVYEVETKEDTNSYEITCYDKMLYAMKDYQRFVNEYPITIRDYIDELAKYIQLGFANKTDTFVNYDKEISSELYLKEDGGTLNYTFRDVLDELAQVTASTICINNEDKIEIRYIPSAEPVEQGKNLLNETLGFVNGYISASNVFTDDPKTALYNQYIAVEGGETYTFSTNANINNMVISMYDSSDTFLGRQKVSNTSKLTQTMDNNVAYVRFAINYNNSATMTQAILDSLEIMAELGSNRTTPYEPYIEPIPEAETIDDRSLKDINVNFGEKYGPINSIVLSRAGDSDSVYLRDDNSIAQNGLCEIKISENQIMNGNDRSDYLPDILEQLDGLEYYINDFSSTGITYLELCDRYNIEIGENIYPCVMFNDEVLVTQGLQENVHTDMPKETETDYTKADKTDRRINQTYIIADKQQGQIQALASQTERMQDELRNVYTKEQINELIIDAQTGVTNTFSEAGGNNIFRNTGLWFENGENDAQQNPYEFWYGNVKKYSEDRASNHNALLLQNATLYQEQQVPNGNYTVSFKYKKNIPLATVSVIINDKEYELTEEDETEFVTGIKDQEGNYIIDPVIVSSQNIKMQFVSDTNDACEIYDLMVNAGQVKLAYSQNQNETTTDTVNISKGITITSSNTDTTFKANSDGIRTLDNYGNELARFTDKGMYTKEIEVEGKSEISGVLIQTIGNQTWFTKI